MRVMSKCHMGVVQRERPQLHRAPDLGRELPQEWDKVGCLNMLS